MDEAQTKQEGIISLPSKGLERKRDPKEMALIKCLNEKSRRLSQMYSGAIEVLCDFQNSDRFALAAHGFRELMEKMGEEIDVEMPEHHHSLKPKVNALQDQWSRTIKNSRAYKGGKWEQNIDVSLRKFLKGTNVFFEWFSQHFPRRKKEVGKLLINLDGARQCLPPPLQELNVDFWQKMQEFFTNVAHHRHETDEKEFSGWKNAFENFLMNLLRPRTFADHEELDALMGGSTHANS